MFELLFLVPIIPFASFIWLATVGSRTSRNAVAAVGVGSIAACTAISLLITASYLAAPPAGGAYIQVLWRWIAVDSFMPQISFYLDTLSLIMMLVVSFVSFIIHLYSAEFMLEDEGYSRFFAYMNLFVASMMTLLLANNLLFLYLGWEGVGLCSYLLIGFWYQDNANGTAAQKAFIVTRVGDTAFAIGLFLLFSHLGTLDIQELMHRAAQQWPIGSSLAVVASALLLGGAVGKSAQLPLQTWLPDAMAGPTPTSALIHAATMVTAGVYLIGRTHVLFSLAPPTQLAVSVVGAATLLLAGCSAVVQSDIKRVLAYSTISQIGYMFLALGVGAWSAAIFHFMTHAFFKALLFLVAGVVIQALHEEHDIFRMGGLRKDLPYAFWGFVIGGSALAGLPLITAGFYSKDLILWQTWSSSQGSAVLWIAGMVGVLLTSLYIYRLIFLVFYGEKQMEVSHRPGWRIKVPIVILCVLAIVGGFVNIPKALGNVPAFTNLLHSALPQVAERQGTAITETLSEGIAAILFALGLALAYLLFLKKQSLAESMASAALGRAIHRFWFADWGMDWLYDHLFVRPVLWFANVDRNDFIDGFYIGLARLNELTWRALRTTENGRIGWYAAGITAGTVVFLAIVLWT
ncbi:MAG TPA: NADH-quinone oxidoreductase subunit L [Terriglobales bacterium]|nr:NADH-quinone oxidoreductase subunit L [Terriglobales bacterium]